MSSQAPTMSTLTVISRRLASCLPLLLLLALPLRAAGEGGSAEDTSPFKELKYRNIGPALGGRVTRVCGVRVDPLVYYAALAAGGIWKSTDGGFTWRPVFDKEPCSSVGCIAVAPSDPNVVYAGSGEG